jgi:hypothetical protein
MNMLSITPLIRKLLFYRNLLNLLILILIGLLLTVFVVLGLREFWSTNAETPQWQSASSVVPKTLLEKVIAQNSYSSSTESPLNISLVKAMILEQQNPFYVFEFNTPKLCGTYGCLYAVYSQQGESYQSVLSLYLNRNLPPSTPLINLKDALSGGKPCLVINQEVPNSNQVLSFLYCEEGIEYQLVNESLLN